jgi:septal ring factor EnvC (AmiA/AmiB activator)
MWKILRKNKEKYMTTEDRLNQIDELLRKQAHENRMLEDELRALKDQLKSVEQDIINMKYDDNH